MEIAARPLTGLLVGTLVGDTLGLPREGLSRRRAARLYPGPLRQRLVFGHGIPSDDTEHACMTAQALLVARADPSRFARVLARKLRWWLAALPAAVGWGTLRALLWRRPVHSAGNGAAMRAPIIGAWFDALDDVIAFTDASTLVTHRDPRAVSGARAIAIAAHHAARGVTNTPTVLAAIRARTDDAELLGLLERVEAALAGDLTPAAFSDDLGLSRGVTGYVHHTVPVVLHAWLRTPRDAVRVLTDVIELGGDADTTGAIAGALVGATVGAAGFPSAWLAIVDAPRTPGWVRALGARADARSEPLHLWWPFVPLRNAVFVLVVLAIGLRRCLPPY